MLVYIISSYSWIVFSRKQISFYQTNLSGMIDFPKKRYPVFIHCVIPSSCNGLENETLLNGHSTFWHPRVFYKSPVLIEMIAGQCREGLPHSYSSTRNC